MQCTVTQQGVHCTAASSQMCYPEVCNCVYVDILEGTYLEVGEHSLHVLVEQGVAGPQEQGKGDTEDHLQCKGWIQVEGRFYLPRYPQRGSSQVSCRQWVGTARW